MFAEFFFGWIKRGKEMDAMRKRVMLACLACQAPPRNEIAEYKRRMMIAWLTRQSS